MRAEAGTARGLLAMLAVLAMAVAAAAVAVWWSGRPPGGPVEVAWDQTRCAHCGMLVSEPGFAAQLHQRDGRVLVFDDPGCLLVHLEEMGTAEPASGVHELWFHDHDEPRWVPGERVVFERVETSPMGYGLAAHERGDLGGRGLDLASARRLALARERSRLPAGGAQP